MKFIKNFIFKFLHKKKVYKIKGIIKIVELLLERKKKNKPKNKKIIFLFNKLLLFLKKYRVNADEATIDISSPNKDFPP